MSEDFNSDSMEEIENDFDDDKYQWGIRKFMPDLPSYEEELSTEKLESLSKQFSDVFAQRHPSSGLKFFIGSFDEALKQSILNLENPRPLILYIRHNESVTDNIFCVNLLCSEKIVNRLNEEFIIWPWDRTTTNNYGQFLKLLIKSVGGEVATEIVSYPYGQNPDQYPLLVCLSYENSQYNIVHFINSTVVEVEAIDSILCNARYEFDHRNDQNRIIAERQKQNWYIPKSDLTLISRQSDQFKKIVDRLNIKMRKIINIQTIENLIWSIQYSCEKSEINNRNEEEVFYQCPSSMAKSILQYGFDYDSNRIHGDKYARGFYFSSKRDLCENYSSVDQSDDDEKAVIICRILIDPDRYNPTDDGSNIFVVSRNEQILPKYLVIYNK